MRRRASRMLRSSSTARTRGRSAGHDIVPASVSIIRPVSPTPWLRRVVEGDSVTEYTYDSFGLKVVLQTAPVRPPNAEVMSKLEELNRLVPDRDVIITSGSEPRKNPTKDSRHPLGAAADIKIPGLTSAEVAELGAQIGFIGS